ncbi:hypothetical protein ACFYPK_05465 [Streptomyces halstedii]|uniref:hypothetical protein n=1 Tax=Streptomyces halstedii TaxID=1944 RepID=UPI0004A8C293|nr:hypothetical protein DT87_03840 [Streptomyces sp. NTK 937]
MTLAQAGPYADTGPRAVFVTPVARGRWTWTHGGGSGAPVRPAVAAVVTDELRVRVRDFAVTRAGRR